MNPFSLIVFKSFLKSLDPQDLEYYFGTISTDSGCHTTLLYKSVFYHHHTNTFIITQTHTYLHTPYDLLTDSLCPSVPEFELLWTDCLWDEVSAGPRLPRRCSLHTQSESLQLGRSEREGSLSGPGVVETALNSTVSTVRRSQEGGCETLEGLAPHHARAVLCLCRGYMVSQPWHSHASLITVTVAMCL